MCPRDPSANMHQGGGLVENSRRITAAMPTRGDDRADARYANLSSMGMATQQKVASLRSSPPKLIWGMGNPKNQAPPLLTGDYRGILSGRVPFQPGPFVSKNMTQSPWSGNPPVPLSGVEPSQADHRVPSRVDQTMCPIMIAEHKKFWNIRRGSTERSLQIRHRSRMIDKIAGYDEDLGSFRDDPIDTVSCKIGGDLTHEMDIR
jgi:hypothetical protein